MHALRSHPHAFTGEVARLAPWKVRALAVLAVVAAAGLALHVAHDGFGFGGRPLDGVADGALHSGLEWGAALGCLTRAAWVRRQRGAWLLMGLGICSYAVGETLWFLWLGRLASPPFPSVCDAFWVSFYVLAMIALGMLVHERIRVSRASLWLDGVMGGFVVAAVGVALLLEPVLATTGGSLAVAMINLAYPILDLLLLAAVVGTFALTGWRPGRTWLTLGVGLALLGAADIWYVYSSASGLFLASGLGRAMYTVALVTIGLAAWQRTDDRASVDMEGLRVLALPSVFVLAAGGVLGIASFHHVNVVAVVLSLATIVLTVVRTGLTFHEVRAFADTRREALTDDLTGLANRRTFYRRADVELAAARTAGRSLALLMIDLDHFKELNDTLGHHVGDTLLQQVAQRLRGLLGPDDLLARLGGDEFAAILASGADSEAARAAGMRVHAALGRPFLLDGIPVNVDASVGAALFPEHAADRATLLRHADIAMYQAKSRHTRLELYQEARNTTSRERIELIGRLGDAITAGELLLHYQPKADLRTGRVVGAEALVRWQHPERGLLSPAVFLPAAEQTGLMRPLTLFVLDAALRDCADWARSGHMLHVAVNLSAVSLIDRDLPSEVQAALDRHGVPPHRLRLEVTENVVMADQARAREILATLQGMGVRMSLDDFGTGYSSLGYLKRLAVDELKIDRSFVSDLRNGAEDAAIVRSMIELGRSLGLRVVAEGVETAAEWQFLAAHGCDDAQGYLLSQPLSASDFEDWLEERYRHAA